MKQTILVVDDDEGIIEVVRIVLESEGYMVRISTNEDFIHHLAEDPPNLILLDVLLSGTDGRDICRAIKNDQKTCTIPVIILSAHSDIQTTVEISGADDFLEKPFDVDDLLNIVAKHLSTAETA